MFTRNVVAKTIFVLSIFFSIYVVAEEPDCNQVCKIPDQHLKKVTSVNHHAGMVYISSGTLITGDDNLPKQPVTINAFWMDATEVTNAQFQKFVIAVNYVTRAEIKSDRAQKTLATLTSKLSGSNAPPNQPVTNISLTDAQAYCRWTGKRLPTQAEWQWAAQVSARMTLSPAVNMERKGFRCVSNN